MANTFESLSECYFLWELKSIRPEINTPWIPTTAKTHVTKNTYSSFQNLTSYLTTHLDWIRSQVIANENGVDPYWRHVRCSVLLISWQAFMNEIQKRVSYQPSGETCLHSIDRHIRLLHEEKFKTRSQIRSTSYLVSQFRVSFIIGSEFNINNTNVFSLIAILFRAYVCSFFGFSYSFSNQFNFFRAYSLFYENMYVTLFWIF